MLTWSSAISRKTPIVLTILPATDTENGRNSLLYSMVCDLGLFIYALDRSRTLSLSGDVFRRSTAAPWTIAPALSHWCLGRSCIRWSLAPSSCLMSPERRRQRRRRRRRVEGWLIREALRSGCFLPLVGRADPCFLPASSSSLWLRPPTGLQAEPPPALQVGPGGAWEARSGILPPPG